MSASLKPRDRVLLLALMAVNEEVSNPVLRERTGLEVDRAARERLTALGLVTSAKRGRSIWYELTDSGWAWCGQELSHAAPPRSDTAIATSTDSPGRNDPSTQNPLSSGCRAAATAVAFT